MFLTRMPRFQDRGGHRVGHGSGQPACRVGSGNMVNLVGRVCLLMGRVESRCSWVGSGPDIGGSDGSCQISVKKLSDASLMNNKISARRRHTQRDIITQRDVIHNVTSYAT